MKRGDARRRMVEALNRALREVSRETLARCRDGIVEGRAESRAVSVRGADLVTNVPVSSDSYEEEETSSVNASLTKCKGERRKH